MNNHPLKAKFIERRNQIHILKQDHIMRVYNLINRRLFTLYGNNPENALYRDEGGTESVEHVWSVV